MSAMLPLGIEVGSVGIWTVAVLLLLALVKAWPALLRIQRESDVSLRGDLMKRVTELEKQVAELSRKLAQKEADHAAEMQWHRHALNNEAAALDSLLLVLKTSPDKVSEAIELVMLLRSERMTALAQEKAAMAQQGIHYSREA